MQIIEKPFLVDCRAVGIWRREILSKFISKTGRKGCFMTAHEPEQPIPEAKKEHMKFFKRKLKQMNCKEFKKGVK